MCCLGPHRDDLAFLSLDHDVALYGSRGQQRTVALALKLAEADFLRQRTGEQPILLLDDVLSELDEHRRRFVLSSVAPEQQVLLTTTDLADFSPAFLGSTAVYNVREGIIDLVSPAGTMVAASEESA
jgi:DNA replication and repair protein RecF